MFGLWILFLRNKSILPKYNFSLIRITVVRYNSCSLIGIMRDNNNIIKIIKRIAYGFKNEKSFKFRLFHLLIDISLEMSEKSHFASSECSTNAL